MPPPLPPRRLGTGPEPSRALIGRPPGPVTWRGGGALPTASKPPFWLESLEFPSSASGRRRAARAPQPCPARPVPSQPAAPHRAARPGPACPVSRGGAAAGAGGSPKRSRSLAGRPAGVRVGRRVGQAEPPPPSPTPHPPPRPAGRGSRAAASAAPPRAELKVCEAEPRPPGERRGPGAPCPSGSKVSAARRGAPAAAGVAA